jgi:peptidoglycan biosynthesis protein MviN/MurJ (putative lipid II flippase)
VQSISPTLFRQRFVVSLAYNTLLLVLFVLLTAILGAYESQQDFGLTAFGLVIANIVFSGYAYHREHHIREGFLTGTTNTHIAIPCMQRPTSGLT